MSFFDHLQELRERVIKSLISIVFASLVSLLFIRPLVSLLEAPASSIHFLQIAPGEFLFISIKVAGYSGLTISIPFILYQGLSFVLPGLTKEEKKFIIPAICCSAILFFIGIGFAWWTLIPAALNFLIGYGSDVVEPLWSIEKYLEFVLVLMLSTGIAFQLPILQLILGGLGIINSKKMISSWRIVVITSAIAGAILTPSTDPITMLILSSAISVLFFIGVMSVAFIEKLKERTHQVSGQN